ncbi:hypothetical protein ACLOJD_04835 [Rothia dentocariosa]|uniref:hypothetical protein n=1 Tax=Rothia dentocariosa TaxID=2047 RepID=UPI003A86A6BB
MQIHLVIAAVTEDNSRGRDFGGNIQVGTGLIRVLYIFVGDTIVSTPQDATPASADAQTSQHENP